MAGVKCSECRRKVRRGVQCSECEKLFHFKCSNSQIECGDDWKCNGCIGEKENKFLEEKEATIESLRRELAEAKQQISCLESENENLKKQICDSEGGMMVEEKKQKVENNVEALVMGDSIVRFSGDQCRKQGALVKCFPGIRAE